MLNLFPNVDTHLATNKLVDFPLALEEGRYLPLVPKNLLRRRRMIGSEKWPCYCSSSLLYNQRTYQKFDWFRKARKFY